MKQIEKATENFIYEIRDTEEYKQYILQRERVGMQPELKSQLDEFRQKNYQLQNSDDDDLFDKVDDLEKEYKDLRDNPLVSEFLAAEVAFCRMMQNINVRIVDAIDFE